MIYDQKRHLCADLSEHDAALYRILAHSATRFCLTGSHYFGCATPQSDVDFITQDCEDTRAELEALGFRSVFGNGEYDEEEGGNADVLGSGKVHVQLARNIDHMRAARDFLAWNMADRHRKADREERAYLWGTLIRLLSFQPGVALVL